MVLWLMTAAQLIAWGWFSIKGGKLGDRMFLAFTVGMLLGQLAVGIESYYSHGWRAFVVQAYFFVFTAVGGIQRLRQMRKKEV